MSIRTAYYLIICIFIILIIIPVLLLHGVFWGQESSDIVLKVYKHQSNQVEKMFLDEYLRGVLAAEMPALYHMEALKAQAVAARTYTIKQLPAYGGTGCRENPSADISTDYRSNQAWLSEDEMKEKWGFISYFYNWARINRAIEQTEGEVLVYNKKVIDAVYHANSGGQTEEASFVWGGMHPYLQSVSSPYDQKRSANYLNTFYFGVDELRDKLGLDGDDSSLLIRVSYRSNSGRVLELMAGDRKISGNDFRSLLGLKSNKFKISRTGDIFTITVYGKGHGVGMSQDGADGYARVGYDYRQILEHYYPGTKIVRFKK